MSQPTNFFWFRRDLRLSDNHGLYKALQSGLKIQCVFIFDTTILERLPKNDKRVSYIYQALQSVNQQLEAYNSSLLIGYGKPLDVWNTWCKTHNIAHVFCNEDYEPEAIKRDEAIHQLLKANGISLNKNKDHLICKKGEVVKSDGSPYQVFTPYFKQWLKKVTISELPNYTCKLSSELFANSNYAFPSITSLGFDFVKNEWPSEQPTEQLLNTYEKTRDFPWIDGTTKLSVALRFGTISIRLLTKTASENSEVWLKELVWREFFSQIMQWFPEAMTQPFKENYKHIIWPLNETYIERWKEGLTGFLMVDAGMRQLNQTGWMHNRVRMVVASFFTKQMLQDYRIGEAYFAEKLMDFELSSNNGNWQWAASTGCDATPYFRIFNPESQQHKFDKNFEYIKKWIPEYGTEEYPKPMLDAKLKAQEVKDFFKQQLS